MTPEMRRAKQKIDRLGGVASILTGLVCLGIGIYDLYLQHGIWKVWAGMCVLLVGNGLLMLREARRAATVLDPKRPESASGSTHFS